MVHYCHGRFAEARSALEGKENTLQLAFLDAAVASKLGDKKLAQERWLEAEARYRQVCQEILAREAAESVAEVFSGSWWEFAYDQAMRRLAYEATSGAALPDDPWQRLIQARGDWLIGEKEKAEGELAAAAAANPKEWELWAARARLFSKWGQQDRARADWQKVVDLAGADPIAWTERGRWYAERGERENAAADFAKAASLAPDKVNDASAVDQGKPRPDPPQTPGPAAEAKPKR